MATVAHRRQNTFFCTVNNVFAKPYRICCPPHEHCCLSTDAKVKRGDVVNVHQNTRKNCLLLAWTTAQVKKPFIRESIDTETFGWKPLQNRPRCWFFYFLKGERSELLDNGIPIPKTSKHLLICFLFHSLCLYMSFIYGEIYKTRERKTQEIIT